MNRGAAFLFLALLGGIAVRADQADDAIVAAMKLATAPSYTWNAAIVQNAHALEMHGKTVPEGFSLVTFVGYVGGSVSGLNSGSGGKINTAFLGDSAFVVESNGNWLTPGTGSAADEPAESGKKSATTSGSGRSAGGRSGRNRNGGIGGTGGMGQRRGSAGSENQDTPTVASSPRLPTGINLPHEALAVVAANYSDLHTEDGGVSGKLTQSGAELLLLPPGSTQNPPKNPAGTFRLWIKDGAVTKYELKLTAASAPGSAGTSAFAQSMTVELSDVGTTKVDVPPAAKKKLGV